MRVFGFCFELVFGFFFFFLSNAGANRTTREQKVVQRMKDEMSISWQLQGKRVSFLFVIFLKETFSAGEHLWTDYTGFWDYDFQRMKELRLSIVNGRRLWREEEVEPVGWRKRLFTYVSLMLHQCLVHFDNKMVNGLHEGAFQHLHSAPKCFTLASHSPWNTHIQLKVQCLCQEPFRHGRGQLEPGF